MTLYGHGMVDGRTYCGQPDATVQIVEVGGTIRATRAEVGDSQQRACREGGLPRLGQAWVARRLGVIVGADDQWQVRKRRSQR
jgi:hypothetical protein